MTKHRPPLSIDAALARIAGELPGGYDEMAVVAQRQVRTVRNWSDPDAPEQVPVDCAVRLDLAYQQAGGIGAPIWEAYTVQLKLGCAASFARPQQLARILPEILRESGEATAAIAEAAQPGATRDHERNALREIEEGIAAFHRARGLLAHNDEDPDHARHQTGPPATGD